MAARSAPSPLVPPPALDWRALAWRAWWWGLVLIHLPVFARVSAGLAAPEVGLAQVASWLGLLGAIVFFVLKARDAAFLRLSSRKLSILVFLIACGLLHQEYAGAVAVQKVLPEAAAIAAPLVLVIAAVRLRRRLVRLLDGLGRAFAQRLLLACRHVGALPLGMAGGTGALAAGLAAPRGPPIPR